MLTGMINLRRARAGWVVVMTAGTLLAAGCGSNDSASNEWDSAAPSTPREELLLTPSEFPADTEKLVLPQDKLREAISDIAGIEDNATYTPAECGSAQQDLGAATNELLSQSAIAGATGKSGTFFVEFVAGRTGDLQRIADSNKRCGDVSMTSTVDDQAVTSTAHIEAADVPAELKAANAIVFRTATTATFGTGTPITTTALLGFAEVRGTTVAVRAFSLSDTVDEAAFRQFFVAAAQKVRNAT